MTKIQKRESSELTIGMNEWGQESLNLSDVEIPKIQCMQSQSPLVEEKKAYMGELRASHTHENLGDPDHPLEVIPFHKVNRWLIKEGDTFVRFDSWTPDNDGAPWEFTEHGRVLSRHRVMQYFVMLPKDIETGNAIPYILNFQGASTKGGRILYTQMYLTNKSQGKVPPAKHFLITPKKEKSKQGGTYYALSVTVGDDSTPKEIKECFKWFKLVSSGQVRVDERPETTREPSVDTPPPLPNQTQKNVEFDESAF